MQVTEQMKRDLAADGAIVVRGMFTPEQLARVRECYDYGMANPGPHAWKVYEGTDDEHHDDYGNQANWEYYLPVIKELGLADFAAALWDSEHVWFLGEELFLKSGGKAGRSPWHQDTAYLAANGPHVLNIWISFERLPKKNGLEIVRGSQHTEYDGTTYDDPDDTTKPLYNDGTWPRLPDIEADRAKDPASWDILSWDVEPGDAVVLHSGTLHGGAPVTPDCPERHTIVFRLFGDKLFARPLPKVETDVEYDVSQYDLKSLAPGEPFRDPDFVQLR